MADKLDMKSMNITEDNVRKIQALFPNVVTEIMDEDGKFKLAIDFDALKQELSNDLINEKQERYQMTWPDKSKAKLLANSRISATLRPDKEKSVNFDTTKNLYIEGDNLDVLKLLRETYLGKIKMIYIDPPYNTGNDFVYEDDFAMSADEYSEISGEYDEQGNRLVKNLDSNGRFHTHWLNMMYPRLKVARDLLKEEGVIFISIDDNEYANLKKLCDEIFGLENFVTTLHVEMSATQGMKVKAAQNGNIVKNAEYILIYSKNGSKNIARKVLYDYRPEYDEHYSKFLTDKLELLSLKDVFSQQFPSIQLRNLADMYVQEPIFKKFVIDNLDKICADDKVTGFELNDCDIGKVTKVVRNNKEYILFNNGKKIRQLLLLKDSFGNCDDFKKSYGLRKIRGDWWREFYLDMGNVSKEGDTVYANGKKPVRLMKQLCDICTCEDDIILDFFSGSSSTAHAVMQLNAEDDGNRRFIMVQIADKIDYSDKDNVKNYKEFGFETICDIAESRIIKSGKRIIEETGKDIDIGFRVFKLDSSNMNDVYYNPNAFNQSMLDMTVDNVKADRTPLDLLFQVMLDLGVELSADIVEKTVNGKKIYAVNGNDLIACFDNDIDNDVITAIATEKPLYAVFKDKSFATDSVGINNEQLFKTYSPATVVKVL
ncbi:MAG: site-specific DNA-methyltransferase [Clostridia bacterium]|nr:site-specific DNA-methyltransferase [Clostridia bacterium]